MYDLDLVWFDYVLHAVWGDPNRYCPLDNFAYLLEVPLIDKMK